MVKKVWNNNIKVFDASLIKDYRDKSGIGLKGLILGRCEFLKNRHIPHTFLDRYIKLIKSHPSWKSNENYTKLKVLYNSD